MLFQNTSFGLDGTGSNQITSQQVSRLLPQLNFEEAVNKDVDMDSQHKIINHPTIEPDDINSVLTLKYFDDWGILPCSNGLTLQGNAFVMEFGGNGFIITFDGADLVFSISDNEVFRLNTSQLTLQGQVLSGLAVPFSLLVDQISDNQIGVSSISTSKLILPNDASMFMDGTGQFQPVTSGGSNSIVVPYAQDLTAGDFVKINSQGQAEHIFQEGQTYGLGPVKELFATYLTQLIPVNENEVISVYNSSSHRAYFIKKILIDDDWDMTTQTIHSEPYVGINYYYSVGSICMNYEGTRGVIQYHKGDGVDTANYRVRAFEYPGGLVGNVQSPGGIANERDTTTKILPTSNEFGFLVAYRPGSPQTISANCLLKYLDTSIIGSTTFDANLLNLGTTPGQYYTLNGFDIIDLGQNDYLFSSTDGNRHYSYIQFDPVTKVSTILNTDLTPWDDGRNDEIDQSISLEKVAADKVLFVSFSRQVGSNSPLAGQLSLGQFDRTTGIITFGQKFPIDDTMIIEHAACASNGVDRHIIAYYDDITQNTYCQIITIEGLDITFGQRFTVFTGGNMYPQYTSGFDIIQNYGDRFFIQSFGGPSNKHRLVVFGVQDLIEKNKFIGITQESKLEGESGAVALTNQVSSIHSGLVPDQKYYISDQGQLSTNFTDGPLVGVALSGTQLKLMGPNNFYDEDLNQAPLRTITGSDTDGRFTEFQTHDNQGCFVRLSNQIELGSVDQSAITRFYHNNTQKAYINTSGNYYTSSDENMKWSFRKKGNKDYLKRIVELPIYSYCVKSENEISNNLIQVGVKYQEIKNIFNGNCVSEQKWHCDYDGLKSRVKHFAVSYQELGCYHILATQQLVKRLDSINDELMKKLDQLEKRIEILEEQNDTFTSIQLQDPQELKEVEPQEPQEPKKKKRRKKRIRKIKKKGEK